MSGDYESSKLPSTHSVAYLADGMLAIIARRNMAAYFR